MQRRRSLKPYLFNGKELDTETGLYYYGARYYDPRVSLWLNVDPLAGRYPHISPYTYVNNNPINLIDPFGLEAEDPPTDSGGFPNGHVLTDGNDSWTRINGGWKNNNDKETQIDEVTITKKAKPKTTTPTLNINSGLFSGWSQAQQANIDAARTRYYTAIANCEACQELKAFERFLFIEVPFALATGGTYSIVGRVGGTGIRLLGGQTIGTYIQGATIRGGMDILTQYGLKGNVDYRQTAINSLVVGYKWGLTANFVNNNYNSFYTQDRGVQGIMNDLPKNFLKTGTSAIFNKIGQYGPTIQSHGTAGTATFEFFNQGIGNINDLLIDREIKQ